MFSFRFGDNFHVIDVRNSKWIESKVQQGALVDLQQIRSVSVGGGIPHFFMFLGKVKLRGKIFYMVYDLKLEEIRSVSRTFANTHNYLPLHKSLEDTLKNKRKEDKNCCIEVCIRDYSISLLKHCGKIITYPSNFAVRFDNIEMYHRHFYDFEDESDLSNTVSRRRKRADIKLEINDMDKVALGYDNSIVSMRGRKKKKVSALLGKAQVNSILDSTGIVLNMNEISSSAVKTGSHSIDQVGLKFVTEMNADDLLEIDTIESKSFSALLSSIECLGKEFTPDNFSTTLLLDAATKFQDPKWSIDPGLDMLSIDEMKSISCKSFEMDIDSVVLVIYSLSPKLKTDINQTMVTVDEYQISINNVQERINSFKKRNTLPQSDFNVNKLALQVVSYFVDCISSAEKDSKLINTDTSKLNENNDLFKKPTIGLYPTKYGEASFDILSLPTTRSSGNEPQWAWIYGKNLKKRLVVQCIQDISIAILLLLKPSSYIQIIQNIIVQEPTYSNCAAQVPGGIWLARCVYILYSMLGNKKASFIEETYNGKLRSSNNFFNYESFYKSDCSTDQKVASEQARQVLSSNYNSHTGSMLRYYSSNLFEAEINVGIGIQLNGSFKKNKLYFCMPPNTRSEDKDMNGKSCDSASSNNINKSKGSKSNSSSSSSSNLSNNGDNNNNINNNDNSNDNSNSKSISNDSNINTESSIKTSFYTYGGLPKEVAGYTQENVKETGMYGRERKKPFEGPRRMRNQFYSTTYRQALGEYTLNKNVEKVSNRIKLESGTIESADQFSPDFQLDQINTYTTMAVENNSFFRENGGFRLESCYLFSENTDNFSKERIIFNNNNQNKQCEKMIEQCIMSSFQDIRSNSKAIPLSIVADYSSVNQGLYIKLYNACILSLKKDNDAFERLGIMVYLRRILEFLSIYYNGRDSLETRMERKEEKVSNIIGRNLLLTMPVKVHDVLIEEISKKNKTTSSYSVEESSFFCGKNNHRKCADIDNVSFINQCIANGRMCGEIRVCSECKKFYRNLDRLHIHLEDSPSCKKSHANSKNRVNISKMLTNSDIKNYMTQVISLLKDSEMGQKAIQQVTEGRSIFIQGKAGTGKSFLLQVLIEYIFIFFKPSEVIMTAPTGIACYNVDPECQTFHRTLGYSELKIGSNISTEVDKIVQNEKVMNKLKTCRFLIIDEIGYCTTHIVKILDNVLRVAHNKSDSYFGGVQIICSGQVVQLAPIYDDDVPSHLRTCAAIGCHLDEICVPIHLTKLMRTTGDEVYENLSSKAHLGTIEQSDLEYFEKCGKQIADITQLPIINLTDKDEATFFKTICNVVHLTHTWEQLFKYCDKVRKTVHNSKKASFEIKCVYTDKNDKPTAMGEDDNASNLKAKKYYTRLILFIGCPLLITHNYKQDDKMGSGKNGVRCYWHGIYDKSTNKKYTSPYDLNAQEIKNSADHYITVVQAMNSSEFDTGRFALICNVEIMIGGVSKLKKHVLFYRQKIILPYNAITRHFFKFMYGYCITAMKTQGMTMQLLSTNIKYFYKNGDNESAVSLESTPGYFYVLITRVKNLDSIKITGLDDCSPTKVLAFVNNQDRPNLIWEGEWILRAKDIDDHISIKYKDQVSLFNALSQMYKKVKAEKNQREYDIQRESGAIREKLLQICRVQQISLTSTITLTNELVSRFLIFNGTFEI